MPIRPSLCRRPALLCLTLTLLAGCAQLSRPAPDQVDPQAMQQFSATLQQVLRRSLAENVLTETVGALKLRVSYDRQGRPLSCTTAPAAARFNDALPKDIPRTRWEDLTRTVERQCWNTLYPKPPEGLFGKNDKVEVLAPLVLVFAAPTGAEWHRRNAQRAFFWQQLVSKETVDSLGVAVIRYRADATGKPLGCLAYLIPSDARPDGFKLDTGLQNRLGSQCLKLDLSQLPGTTLNEHQQFEGQVAVEYAPWKRPQP